SSTLATGRVANAAARDGAPLMASPVTISVISVLADGTAPDSTSPGAARARRRCRPGGSAAGEEIAHGAGGATGGVGGQALGHTGGAQLQGVDQGDAAGGPQGGQ